MTSSLVGSEMCIRDRYREGAKEAVSGCLVGRWFRWDCSSGVSSRALAVSYTHLTLPTICSV
eukprot:7164355-Prorocentrum_lima.AAC.1